MGLARITTLQNSGSRACVYYIYSLYTFLCISTGYKMMNIGQYLIGFDYLNFQFNEGKITISGAY